MKRTCLLILALACAPQAANAQLVCSLSLTPLSFGSLASTASGTYDARGSVAVTCTGSQGANIAACIDLAPGAVNASGQRLLSTPKGTTPLPMQIFQDATLSRPWGSAAMGQAPMLQRTGDGPIYATVYARLYVPHAKALPGAYMANIPVTLRYGTVLGGFADCGTLGHGPAGVSAMTAASRKTK
jgi:spore coat protein U-like protein